MTKLFYEDDLSLDTIWRSILLIGKNNKTYKFALAKSLLQLAKEQKQTISISELAPYFAKNTLEHVATGNSQGVDSNKSGVFLNACESFLKDEIGEAELFDITEKSAFEDVIERFHVVNRGETEILFYDYSSFKKGKKIVLKDEVFDLLNSEHGSSLLNEIEARWKLVETAWQLKIPPHLLNVEYDEDEQEFYLKKNELGRTRRINVTKSRDALNGYQKGSCFFCFDDISINSLDKNLCHVDHFFPHTLFDRLENNINYNGVWNLVLSCKSCNFLKSTKIPSLASLNRLHTRNEFYISSHLPLKESILKTGNTEQDRRSFLQERFNESKDKLVTTFTVLLKKDPRF